MTGRCWLLSFSVRENASACDSGMVCSEGGPPRADSKSLSAFPTRKLRFEALAMRRKEPPARPVYHTEERHYRRCTLVATCKERPKNT